MITSRGSLVSVLAPACVLGIPVTKSTTYVSAEVEHLLAKCLAISLQDP